MKVSERRGRGRLADGERGEGLVQADAPVPSEAEAEAGMAEMSKCFHEERGKCLRAGRN